MKHQSIRVLLPALTLIGVGALTWAQTAPISSTGSIPADNTKNNQSDQTNRMSTADMQRDDASDIQMSKRIRESIVADKSLSTYAHNVKIVTVNGNVTLNGVVHSEHEKSAIEMKAMAAAGNGRVVNALKVTDSH
jgi:hyperosmotically inducible protein